METTQIQENKGKIIQVFCPHCGLQMYKHSKQIDENTQKSEWRCRDCIYIYDDSWFNTFNHFERFVRRKS